MIKKTFISPLFTVVFAMVAVFGNSQVWAGPTNLAPIETTRIVNGEIMVEYDPITGSPIAVSFLVGGEWVPGELTVLWWCNEDKSFCVQTTNVGPASGCFGFNCRTYTRLGRTYYIGCP